MNNLDDATVGMSALFQHLKTSEFSESLASLVSDLPPNERMAMVHNWFIQGVLSKTILSELIGLLWADSEHNINFKISTGSIISMFRSAGFVSNSLTYRPSSGQIPLFRGCLEGYIHRPSWTKSQNAASWFARGHFDVGRKAVLIRGFAASNEILGFFTSREEEEYVIDPFPLINRGIWMIDASDIDIEIRACEYLIHRANFGEDISESGMLGVYVTVENLKEKIAQLKIRQAQGEKTGSPPSRLVR